jgi:transcriptional regulator with XRE-family HTH domain
VQSRTFAWVGETLRRVRKEQGKTLSELAVVAKVGKGQLSRIETGKQEITLGTLAKVLAAYGLSRQEFFRRYDAVENGERDRAGETRSPGAGAAADPLRWTEKIRETIGRIESFLTSAAHDARPVAQGGFEVGEHVVLFRVLPRSAEGGAGEGNEPASAATGTAGGE